MAYQPQNFKDNTILTATMLNTIEEGLMSIEQSIKNFAEVNATTQKINSVHLPDNILTEEKLVNAIYIALNQAYTSGQFNGKDGETPIKGTHYWTNSDKEEIIQEVTNRIGSGNEVEY